MEFSYEVITFWLEIEELARRQIPVKENPHVQLCTRSMTERAPLVRGSSVTDGVKCGTQPTHISLYTTVSVFAFVPSF